MTMIWGDHESEIERRQEVLRRAAGPTAGPVRRRIGRSVVRLGLAVAGGDGAGVLAARPGGTCARPATGGR